MSDIFGAKPEVAPYIPTEFGEEQLKSITENISAFPEISKLGDLYYTYMMGGMEKAIPGFSDILATGGKLTQAMQAEAAPLIRGELPPDVAEQVARSSAFKSLMAGTAGGPMGTALTARDLGLTSLDLMKQGAAMAGEAGNAAQRWAGLAGGMIMSPSGMMVTPQQQAALTMQNRLYQQATQQLKYNIAAQPSPFWNYLHKIGSLALSSYLGHGMGGGSVDASQNWAAQGGVQAGAPTAGLSKDEGGFGGGFYGGGVESASGDFYGGYGGVAPTYYGLESNPFAGSNVSFNIAPPQQAPSTGGADLWGGSIGGW